MTDVSKLEIGEGVYDIKDTVAREAFNNVADKDLSNITSSAKNISSWATNISNAITEIAQDLNFELSGGVLTLKAGSKVYVPNGEGVFTPVTTTADASLTSSSVVDENIMIAYNNNSGRLFIARMSGTNNVGSGTIANRPVASTMNFGAGLYYATDENIVYMGNKSNDTWTAGASLPLAIASVNGVNGYTKIKQAFNGFGYIGSTIFVLPGVKGLIPNGRNDDGTLKSTAFTNDICVIANLTGTHDYSMRLAHNYLTVGVFPYEEKSNYNYNETIASGNERLQANAGDVVVTSGKITAFNPRRVFHSSDFNDVYNKTEIDELNALNAKAANVYTKTQVDNIQARNVQLSGNQSIAGEKTFSDKLFAPQSDVLNTVVTTVQKQKSDDGYFVLGNGLIIQWIRNRTVTNGGFVTLPTAFTTDKYGVAITDTNTYAYVCGAQNQQTTGFTIYTPTSTRSVSIIAIGY